jgi:hypothetical protein
VGQSTAVQLIQAQLPLFCGLLDPSQAGHRQMLTWEGSLGSETPLKPVERQLLC